MNVQLKPLEEQTLVITGASSGIGLTTALEAARRGARLVLVARNPDTLEDAADRCRAEGADVEIVAADVADRATINLVVERTAERFGSDLIVMGSYKYARWLEQVTGGVLDDVVAGSQGAVLIA